MKNQGDIVSFGAMARLLNELCLKVSENIYFAMFDYYEISGGIQLPMLVTPTGEHARINQTATRGDGASFARHVFDASRRR